MLVVVPCCGVLYVVVCDCSVMCWGCRSVLMGDVCCFLWFVVGLCLMLFVVCCVGEC